MLCRILLVISTINTPRPPTFQLVTPPDKLFTFLIYNRQKTPPTFAYSQNLPALIWIQP